MSLNQQAEHSVKEPATPLEWDSYFDLRWRVLREPWNQPVGSERDALDGQSFHLMIWDGAAALAVGRLHLNGPEEAQVRYMAVDPAFQDQGLGGKLLGGLEKRARSQGVQRIVLNARANVVGFYTRLGYEITGPGETLFGEIRHTKMCKVLNAPAGHVKSG